MANSNYIEALKLGQKDSRASVAAGKGPYLETLDEILKNKTGSSQVELGLLQVPAELIVGTVTEGRSKLFSPGFMPLAAEGTEFSMKWERLCKSHLDEGIRDPIKAYEYLNRYYVAEGNKRVSVLKFFDAATIPATVTSIRPERDGSPESELYYAFDAFAKLSGLRIVEFSKPASYRKLQELLGKEPEQVWTDRERSAFLADYSNFRQVYSTLGGMRLHVTVGDALLAFLEVYGYEGLRGKSSSELKKQMSKIWEEIHLQQEDAPIDVKLDPPEEKKPGLITKVLTGAPPATRVAFIHDGTTENSRWTQGHEKGRLYVEKTMAGQIETVGFGNALEGDPLEVIEQAIEEGCSTIFTTSPRLMPAALRAAVEHPEITIFNCSLNQPHRYIRTYYARMYEAKFVLGAIAASLAGSDSIGYICDYPIFGQIAGINAFALGALLINPRVKVYLEWTSVSGIEAAIERLRARGIRLISSQDLVREGEQSRSLGLLQLSGNEQIRLATPLWQWGTYYQEILRRVRSHTTESEYKESPKAVNYYWGMSAGVVDVELSDMLPYATRRLATLLCQSIRSGLLNPFGGPLYKQGGLELDHGELLKPEQIIKMDELVENVEGMIPRYDELSDIGKATVDAVGVAPATKEPAVKEKNPSETKG